MCATNALIFSVGVSKVGLTIQKNWRREKSGIWSSCVSERMISLDEPIVQCGKL